ncbi:MAG: response regulator [Elusimicrobia bacterium]|nr:response regulator [Elusimicrobiota bacterium]
MDILIVDDSETILFKLEALLKDNGFHVATAVDGKKAVELLNAFKPDLIVTDFNMPGLDGFAMLRLLQGDPAWTNIPVVIITGRALDESTRKLVEFEPNVKRIFLKPIDEQGLLKVIREVGVKRGKLSAASQGPAPDSFEPLFPTIELQPPPPKKADEKN